MTEVRTTADRLAMRDPNDLALGGFVDRQTMRFVRDYPHPPAEVWAALTEPRQLTAWLWPCASLEARLDGHAVFQLEDKTLTLRIVEFEPLRVLNFSGAIRFELAARSGGCRLVLTLKRPPDGWSPMGLAGFHGWLGRLGRLLAGTPEDETELWASQIWNAVFHHYEAEVRNYVADGATVLWRVHFSENVASLTPEAAALVDDLATLLVARGLSVTIDGFGDDPCDAGAGLRLCNARVAAVRERLISAAVPADRINIGFVLGNYHFLVERDSEAGRAFNRRVELRPIY
jgi:hypothetical protein